MVPPFNLICYMAKIALSLMNKVPGYMKEEQPFPTGDLFCEYKLHECCAYVVLYLSAEFVCSFAI